MDARRGAGGREAEPGREHADDGIGLAVELDGAAEDSGIGLIRFDNGAIGQFEVSWTFRGGMDLRDEVSGTEGTIRLDHFLRTGFEMFTAAGEGGYVAEKAEGQTGWLFPVGDEAHELGYVHMFQDMLDARDAGREPMETFYDGYVVNAVIDACYKSMKSGRWEPVGLAEWRPRGGTAEGGPGGSSGTRKTRKEGPKPAGMVPSEVPGSPFRVKGRGKSEKAGLVIVKTERLPDGRVKQILKDKATGRIIERIE